MRSSKEETSPVSFWRTKEDAEIEEMFTALAIQNPKNYSQCPLLFNGN
jgi:hypothetical protein